MTIRKAIGLLISIALILGGCYIVYAEFFGAPHPYVRRIWMLGPFLAIVGSMWVYSDWIEKEKT